MNCNKHKQSAYITYIQYEILVVYLFHKNLEEIERIRFHFQFVIGMNSEKHIRKGKKKWYQMRRTFADLEALRDLIADVAVVAESDEERNESEGG